MIEASESSSDSDFDMIEALENSKELQDYVKMQIKSELETIGPKIFDKIKAEFTIEEAKLAPQARDPDHENLTVSWHLNDKENSAEKDSLRQQPSDP